MLPCDKWKKMVRSKRIFSWAVGTHVTGPISADAVREAVEQFEQAGGGQVWLLDASSADFDLGAVIGAAPELKSQIDRLRGLGLDRIALAMPPDSMVYASMIEGQLSDNFFKVFPFASGDAAMAWLSSGCR